MRHTALNGSQERFARGGSADPGGWPVYLEPVTLHTPCPGLGTTWICCWKGRRKRKPCPQPSTLPVRALLSPGHIPPGTGGTQRERHSGRRKEEGLLCKAPRKGVVWEQQPLQLLGPHRDTDEGLWCCQLALSRPNRKRPGTFYLHDSPLGPAVSVSTGFRRVQDRNSV